MFLQGMDMTLGTEASLHLEWGDKFYFRHLTDISYGVDTLFSLRLQPQILQTTEVVLG